MVLYSTQSIENPLTNVNKHSILRTGRANIRVGRPWTIFPEKSMWNRPGEGLNPSVDGEAIPI